MTTRPRNRKVATGAPYRARCWDCSMTFEFETARDRHCVEFKHYRFENIEPEHTCVCNPRRRGVLRDDGSCPMCCGHVSETVV